MTWFAAMIRAHHYVLAVPDLGRSAAFYRDVLGFTVHTISDPGWLFFVKGECQIMAGAVPTRCRRVSSATIPTSATSSLTMSMSTMPALAPLALSW